jgi:hypothetical protein
MFPLACLLIGGIRKDLLDTKFGILTKLFGPAMLFFSPFEIFGAADLIGADDLIDYVAFAHFSSFAFNAAMTSF